MLVGNLVRYLVQNYQLERHLVKNLGNTKNLMGSQQNRWGCIQLVVGLEYSFLSPLAELNLWY